MSKIVTLNTQEKWMMENLDFVAPFGFGEKVTHSFIINQIKSQKPNVDTDLIFETIESLVEKGLLVSKENFSVTDDGQETFSVSICRPIDALVS